MQRRLAAIFHADVAGYSRLMGVDEAGTLAGLKANRAAIESLIAGRDGRVVKTIGDGLLVEFPSVVDAVEAAVAIQAAMAERGAAEPEARRQLLRIGIHLGDVIVDDGDIYGDGVNIAARLQELAEPGGVALSRIVAESVRGKVAAALADAGLHQLKNIVEPVHVFRIAARREAAAVPTPSAGAPPLPDKPSIAVMPFANMSGDSEQEYFADGITEDIITELSRFPSLFVVARNSTFTFKGKAVDLKEVGRALGVRYVLEGSVRKAGNRVRINGQLIDSATGAHVWADRFDGALDDIFSLQDQVTERVVSALMVNLEQAETERTRRKPTASLDAYDYCLQAKAAGRRGMIEEALQLARTAIERDPDYAMPYAVVAWLYQILVAWGKLGDNPDGLAEAARSARRAASLAPDDPVVLGMAGFTVAYMARDLDAASGLVKRALAMSPNLALNWTYGGWISVWEGRPEAALDHWKRAQRLNPLDPGRVLLRVGMAHAHYLMHRYEEAAESARLALEDNPGSSPALRIGSAALAMAERTDEAATMGVRLRGIDPTLRLSNLAARLGPYRRKEDLAHYAAGLRRAGLPD